MTDELRWVLIDSCGAAATLAVGRGEVVLGSEVVPGREFSAEWPGALRRLLAEAGWGTDALQVVGVVHGPGSFTGVRVGLAAAKGLCEALGAKLIAVSRLEVLAALGVQGALAVLDAGRDEFYVRDEDEERLVCREALVEQARGRDVVSFDQRVVAVLSADAVMLVAPGAVAALPLMVRHWRDGLVDDVAAIDANYVRGEHDIYARKRETADGAQ